MPTPHSRLPRKQRKAVYTASNFARRRYLTVPLSKELRTRYGRRQLPVRKGDTVRVISGSYEGQEERVAKINTRTCTLTLDNITVKKADQKLKPLPVRPNHLLLTRLNLSDAWRRRVLKVTEEPVESAPAPAAKPTAEAAAAPAESAAKAPKRSGEKAPPKPAEGSA
jgi:large subunit ribosomal protein L24